MEYARKHDEGQWGRGRKSKTGAKAALLLSGDDGMVQTALISPLLASIAVAYPDATELMLDQAMSVTAMTMLPAMLCSSVLARYFNKKHLVMFGTLLFMLAGLSAMVAPNMAVLVATRAVLGVGAGIAFPLVPSSIAYLFGEHEKNQMLGWMNACGSFLSFTLSMAAGWVALVDWKLAFLFYLIFVPVLVLQGLFLPDFKPEKREAVDKGLAKEPLNAKMWLVGIAMLLFMVLAMVATFKLSLFVEQSGLGTSADSGAGVSCMTCASFLISLFFAQYVERLGRFAPVVSFCFAALSFFVLSVAQSIPLVFLGMVLLGFCMGTVNPFFMSTMSNVAPETRKTLGMTMTCIFQLGRPDIHALSHDARRSLGLRDRNAPCSGSRPACSSRRGRGRGGTRDLDAEPGRRKGGSLPSNAGARTAGRP